MSLFFINCCHLVFANGPADRGSIPGRVIPKSQKIVLDDALLRTQHCDNIPRPPEYVNFFEPFHFLAGDQLVVPIGVSHISS